MLSPYGLQTWTPPVKRASHFLYHLRNHLPAEQGLPVFQNAPDILEFPRTYGLNMASIEATMICTATLLERVMHFVIGITLDLMKYLKTQDKSYKKKLEAPEVLAFILSVIQRKRSPPVRTNTIS